jgi:regulatory protein
MKTKYLTKEQALQKIKHFCAYQERCHEEVKQKLKTFGIWGSDHSTIIATLIEENYLNEERFAIQYAGSKFRMNQWGKNKIRYALKGKFISEYCINKSINLIDDEHYKKTLQNLAAKKYASLNGEQYLIRKKKTIDYLLQKGYEPELVYKLVSRDLITGQ